MRLFHKSDRKRIDAKSPHDDVSERQNDTEKEHDKSSDPMNSASSNAKSIKEEYDDAVAELMPVKWELVEKKSEISKIKSEYKQVLSELASAREELYHMRSEIANIKSEIDSGKEEIGIQSEKDTAKIEKGTVIDKPEQEIGSAKAELIKPKSKEISADLPFDAQFDEKKLRETYEANDYNSNVKSYEMYYELTNKHPDNDEYRKHLYLLYDVIKKSIEEKQKS